MAKCSICGIPCRDLNDIDRITAGCPYNKEDASVNICSFNNLKWALKTSGVAKTICFIGLPESGKTTLFYQLFKGLSQQNLGQYFGKIGLDFLHWNESDDFEKLLRDLEKSIDQDKEYLPTDEERFWPINFSFRRRRDDRYLKFTFFDMAGEEFQGNQLRKENPRLKNADAYLFLIDASKQLHSDLKVRQSTVSRNISTLQSLPFLIGNKDNTVHRPTAICLTKYDQIHGQVELSPNYIPWLETYADNFNEQGELRVTEMVRNSDFIQKEIFGGNAQTNEMRDKIFKSISWYINGQRKSPAFFVLCPGERDHPGDSIVQSQPKGILSPLLFLFRELQIL